MNWIRRWKERREQRRKLRELQTLASGLRTLDQLEQSGLLAWDAKSRRLFIDSSLALVMMRTAEAWQAFIQNVYLWQYNREAWRTTEEQMTKMELKAVRDYSKAHPDLTLTRADIDRIRAARRLEIAQGDIRPVKVEGFEFLIVSPPNLGLAESAERAEKATAPVQSPGVLARAEAASAPAASPVGSLVAVGHYDPQTEQMEMASWEEVRALVSADEISL